MTFDYREAFSRNIGWVTETEQEILRGKRIAIAGLGGVGGSHLLTLTRLGIGAFNIADLDEFELANFNRQAGANLQQIGKPKVEVLAGMAQHINADLDIIQFPEGVSNSNLDDFLNGVDLYVDALDFFAIDIRRAVFAACEAKGIPAITAAPIGMGAALLCFMPGKMSFEQYFRLSGHSEDEQALRFLLGLSPAMLQMPYLADASRVDFNAKKGPSTPMACELCAGFAGSWALKILLNRGKVPTAPRGVHFDAYRNKLSTTWRPWGNNNPIQRLGLMIARRKVMSKTADGGAVENVAGEGPVERILGLARWAPSGDNEQPWKFEIIDDRNFRIHAHDTRGWCVYDLDGHSSQIAVGALIETIAIAATGEGMKAVFQRDPDSPAERPIVDVALKDSDEPHMPQLLPYITSRVTQRRPFGRATLLPAHKTALSEVVGPAFRVVWVEGKQRLNMAKLLFNSAHIRLTTPEGYEVHRHTIEWGQQFSETRIPEQAVGADYLTMKIMRWALKSWGRVKFLNRFFAGTWLPRIQMDFFTGVGCAAHFLIVANQPQETIDDYIEGGRAVQRFWLEATRLGLQFQPEMTPLIFSRYHRKGIKFTELEREQSLAGEVAEQLAALTGSKIDPSARVYMGRVGYGKTPQSRSTRPALGQLMAAQNGSS